MTGQTERTAGQRIRALRTVGFELRMMGHASGLLRQAQLADEDPMAQNAFLESALLHARTLTAFFIKKRSHASDIHRTDFAPEWSLEPADAVKRLDDRYLLLHKYLAHLTWERVSKDAPIWNYPNIASDILNVAEAWASHLELADKSMGDGFRPHVLLARQALDA